MTSPVKVYMVMVMVGGLEFGKSNNKRYAGPQFNKVWCGYASNRGAKRNYKFVTFCVSIFVSSVQYTIVDLIHAYLV